MFRKLTFTIAIISSLSAFGDGRPRTIGRVSADAALSPIKVPGTTVSGTVTAVSGNIISLAGGLVTVDASQAKISDDRGAAGSIASITPGTIVFAILSSASAGPGGSLPASIIAVTRSAQVTLNGPVQQIGTSSFTLLDRTIAVDSNTSFGGGRVRGLTDILPNDLVQVQANAAGGVLLASSVLVFPPVSKPPAVIRGIVKSIGTDSWIITDSANKDWTIVVNAQTKIIGDPKVGDPVEILVNLDNANQQVALSIMKSVTVQPVIVFSGQVKSMGPTAWVIVASPSREITVALNSQTKITGDPHVNDGVNVTAIVDAAGNYTALAIAKLGIVPPAITIRGVVKSIVGLGCATTACPESVWTIGPPVGLGPDVMVQVNGRTKMAGDPKVGDLVEVMVQIGSTGGYVALSIVKQ